MMNTLKIKKYIASKNTYLTVYTLLCIIVSIQAISLGKKTYGDIPYEYNRYNNYTIFKQSFYHLIEQKDLYSLYPEEQFDLFKYTPTFSVFFGFFALFPDWLGITLWNLCNSLILVFAIFLLPKINNYKKGLICLLIIFEMMTSIQNFQSNGLMVGLILLAFNLFERKKIFLGVFLISFSVFIKLFGLVAFSLILLYPNKLKSFLYIIISFIILLLTPLFFIDFHQYNFLINSYINLLKNDHSNSLGLSVMGWLNTWFNISISKNIIVGTGAIIFMIPFIKIKDFNHQIYKLLLVCSVIIWVVIFNHKAESPTFIIAFIGVCIWFMISNKTLLNYFLFIFSFLFTTLSATDIFPRFIRNEFIGPYTLKAVPVILIWFKIIYDLLIFNKKKVNVNN